MPRRRTRPRALLSALALTPLALTAAPHLLPCAPPRAHAAPLPPEKARAALQEDLRAHPEDYWVFEVDGGYYLVAPREIKDLDELSARTLVGRPQALHGMRIRGSGGELPRRGPPLKWSLYISDLHLDSAYKGQSLDFSHSIPEVADGEEDLAEGALATRPRPSPQLTLECSQEREGAREEVKRAPRLLSHEESGAVLANATVAARPRLPYAAERLFRDDWGRYYLVERRLDPEAGPLLRLWVGYRGALEQLPTMIAAEDSRGVVLVSQDAALRLVAGAGEERGNRDVIGAYWVDRRGERPERRDLLEVPVEINQGVIYNTFGLYDSLYLGSPCDPVFGRPQPEPTPAPPPPPVDQPLPPVDPPLPPSPDAP